MSGLWATSAAAEILALPEVLKACRNLRPQCQQKIRGHSRGAARREDEVDVGVHAFLGSKPLLATAPYKYQPPKVS